MFPIRLPTVTRVYKHARAHAQTHHTHAGDIELRHQRNPDVKFDFVRKGREKTPYIFDVIETLLPTAKYAIFANLGQSIKRD